MSRMKQVGKYIFTVLSMILIGVCVYAGCSYMEKEISIYFISKNASSNYVFWETMRMGAELAAKELGLELHYAGPADENSPEEQSMIVDYVTEKKPQIIIISPIDKEILKEPIEKAKKQGIIVVGVDSTTEEISHNVATDNVEAAKTLMHHMSGMINKEGVVALLNFEAESTSTRDREKGYREAAACYPNIQTLPTIYTDGTTSSAYRETKALLAEHPEIKGIFGVNQYMTEGAYLAVKELRLMGEVKVVGFDSSEVIIEGIEKEGIQAILVQKPFNMGYMSVRTAIELLKGQKIPARHSVDYKLITKDVLYETENQKLIYPIVE